MNTAIMEQRETYREVNSITGSAGSVLFGEGRFAELPVSELVQDLGLNISVCNRSVESAVIEDAFELLEDCVYSLHPHKVFLNFGESDMQREGFDPGRFYEDYRKLIEDIRGRCGCRVYVVSLPGDGDAAAELNAGLKEMTEKNGCTYIDAAGIFRHEKPRLRLFSELVHYMREGRMSFAEAMGACC